MFPYWAHPTSAMCWIGMDIKRQSLVVEENEEQLWRIFLEYGTPLTVVSAFLYLVRVLLSSDDDWPAVEWKLRRAQGK